MRQPHRPPHFQQFTSSLQTGWEPKGLVKSRNMKSALKQGQERKGERQERAFAWQCPLPALAGKDQQRSASVSLSACLGIQKKKKVLFCSQAKTGKSKPASVFKRCVPGLWFLTRSQQVWFRGCPIEGAVCLTLNGVAGASKQRLNTARQRASGGLCSRLGPYIHQLSGRDVGGGGGGGECSFFFFFLICAPGC